MKGFYLHYDCYDANLITTKRLFNPTPCCRFRPRGHAGMKNYLSDLLFFLAIEMDLARDSYVFSSA